MSAQKHTAEQISETPRTEAVFTTWRAGVHRDMALRNLSEELEREAKATAETLEKVRSALETGACAQLALAARIATEGNHDLAEKHIEKARESLALLPRKP